MEERQNKKTAHGSGANAFPKVLSPSNTWTDYMSEAENDYLMERFHHLSPIKKTVLFLFNPGYEAEEALVNVKKMAPGRWKEVVRGLETQFAIAVRSRDFVRLQHLCAQDDPILFACWVVLMGDPLNAAKIPLPQIKTTL